MLYQYHSNKIESLAQRLASVIHFEPLSPLKADQVVVESAAMQHWLTTSISQISGIAADIQFPFPAALVWKIYRQQMPTLAKQSCFDRSPLIWRLLSLLDDPLFFDEYPQFQQSALQRYLQAMHSQQERMSFVEQLANLYDQYQIYRPDWLLNWQEGGYLCANSAPWQADLWALLCQLSTNSGQPQDRASIFRQSMGLFPLPQQGAQQVAERLHIFALSGLAKTYLDLFSQLASSIDIHVYCLNPCCLYWQDVQTQKQQLRQRRVQPSLSDYCESDEQGNNELLALLSKQNRDYIALLQEHENVHIEELFVDVMDDDNPSLLRFLQQDMLWLRQKSNISSIAKTAIKAQDQSILFHSCHSPLREVQVLHNQILAFLQQHPHCKLDDIAIMVPDLETYAPALHAVFSTTDKTTFLPYHVAERQSFGDEGIKKSLLLLLTIHQNQFKREDVLALLQEPSLMRAFGFSNHELLQQLIAQLQVRFGLKDDHWHNMSEQKMVSFSWQQARHRLLSSFAHSESNQMDTALLSGISDDVAHEAGLLCLFIDRLMDMAAMTQTKRSLKEHIVYLEKLLDDFFRADEEFEHEQIRQIRAVLEKMQQSIHLAAVDVEIEAGVFVRQLEQQLQLASANHFIKPSVINIATLLPMRSIPFAFIGVLGMNDGEFPRPANMDQLDLMSQHRRAGDRNRREEDRYLFLEVLLASRERCHFSFIGNSQVDNSERYPSLLLAELMKHLDQHYAIDGQESIHTHLLQKHKLQVFDDVYFNQNNEVFYSYDKHALTQARALDQTRTNVNRDVPVFLKPANTGCVHSTATNEHQSFSIQDLVLAFKKPALHLLRHLNLQEQWYLDDDSSEENFAGDGLDHFQALRQVIDGIQTHRQMTAEQLCRAGFIAQSSLGQSEYSVLVTQAQRLLDLCQQHHLIGLDQRKSMDLKLETYQITGELSGFNTGFNQRMAFIGRKLHGGVIVQAWIEHLICQLVCGELSSYLIDDNAVYKLSSIIKSEAEELLFSIVKFYSLSQQQLSWFFPKSSWAYCIEMHTSADEKKAIKALEKSLLGTHYFDGEWQQSDSTYVYRGHDQLMYEPIIAQAEAVFKPLLEYWQMLDPHDNNELSIPHDTELER